MDIPEAYIESMQSAKGFFLHQLGVHIKENLNCNRKGDSLVEIRIPVARGVFQEFAQDIGIPHPSRSGRGHYTVHHLRDLSPLLGEKWFFRIVNSLGDFEFVLPETFEFWMLERAPLLDYQSGGKANLVHRGFICVVRFVKEKGNKYDFETTIGNLM